MPPMYDSRNTGHRKSILGIYRQMPNTCHTLGTYRHLGVRRHEAMREVLKRGDNHMHGECFDHEEPWVGSCARSLSLAHARARTPRTWSRGKFAREPSFRGERDRQRRREIACERESERQRDRVREMEREKQTQGDKEKENEKERGRYTQSERERERESEGTRNAPTRTASWI